MNLERRDIPPAPILPPKKAKRRRKKETPKSDTVIIIDVPPRVVCEYPADRAARGTGSTAGSQAGAGGTRGQNLVVIGMVAVVVFVLGVAIFKPDAVKTATEFFGALGRMSTSVVTKL